MIQMRKVDYLIDDILLNSSHGLSLYKERIRKRYFDRKLLRLKRLRAVIDLYHSFESNVFTQLQFEF